MCFSLYAQINKRNQLREYLPYALIGIFSSDKSNFWVILSLVTRWVEVV